MKSTSRKIGLQSTTERSTKIVIVDDHPTICAGLSYRISHQPDMTVCGEAADVAGAMACIAKHRPDVSIVDISLKDSDGLDLVKAIKVEYPKVRVLVHSMFDESSYADRCLHAGAMGYLNKEAHPDEVINAIREILAGRVYLSPRMTNVLLTRAVGGVPPENDPVDTLTDRQLEIFRMFGNGKSAAQIADQLFISVHTVETHRENIKRKLNVDTVAELTRLAVLWSSQKR